MAKYLQRLISGFFLLLLIAVPLAVYSEDISPSVSISPAKINLEITLGQLSQTAITIENHSLAALPFKAVAMDFAPRDNQGNVSYDRAIPGRSAKDWLKIEPEEIIVPPKETREVRVTISPPELVEKGSYFAVAMFQAQFPSNYFDPEAQAKIIPWVGSLLLLSVGEPAELTDESLTVKGLDTPRLALGGKLPVQVEVTNNTPFHLSPQTVFGLRGLTGRSDAALDQQTVLPGFSRVFEGELNTSSKLGVYRPEATVMVGSWRKTLGAETLFILSWQKLLILMLGLGTLLAAFKSRRRLLLVLRHLLTRQS